MMCARTPRWSMVVFLALGTGASIAADGVHADVSGRIMLGGTPLAGASITACADGHDVIYGFRCSAWIRTTTDAEGKFSFRQRTGRKPLTPEEQARLHALGRWVDFGWAYGFRVDFDGSSGIFVNEGPGYGRSRVDVECNFQNYLTEMKKLG